MVSNASFATWLKLDGGKELGADAVADGFLCVDRHVKAVLSHSFHTLPLHREAFAMLHILRVGFTTQGHPTLSVPIPARMGGARIVQSKGFS